MTSIDPSGFRAPQFRKSFRPDGLDDPNYAPKPYVDAKKSKTPKRTAPPQKELPRYRLVDETFTDSLGVKRTVLGKFVGGVLRKGYLNDRRVFVCLPESNDDKAVERYKLEQARKHHAELVAAANAKFEEEEAARAKAAQTRLETEAAERQARLSERERLDKLLHPRGVGKFNPNCPRIQTPSKKTNIGNPNPKGPTNGSSKKK